MRNIGRVGWIVIMKVSIERVLYLQFGQTRNDIARLAELSKINKIPFDQIEWYSFGDKVNIPTKVLESWELLGLSNTDFITSNYYSSSSK